MSSAERDALDRASEALSRLLCPYYNGDGVCDMGCREEPACRTDEPLEGWPGALLEAAVELRNMDRS